jgi:glycosyltransferase involved in cell wall biosynthesis
MFNSAASIADISLTKCAVIITHYNYAEFIEDAIDSVLAQTHENFHCVIIDDASDAGQRARVREIIKAKADPRLTLAALKKNVGQVRATFAGVKETDAQFIALLDPDDVYEPDFLAVMLKAHLNERTIAALASCEMGVFQSGRGIVGLESTGQRRRANVADRKDADASLKRFGFSKYFAPWEPGWHWAATSGMMFRRHALELIEPLSFPKGIKFNGDSYCGHGAHMIGGTLFVDKVLSWRRVHDENTARVPHHFSSTQNRVKTDFVDFTWPLKIAAMDSALRRGVHHYFSVASIHEVLDAHFEKSDLMELAKTNPIVTEIFSRMAANVDW